MDRAAFEHLAAEAYRSIPERFLKRLGNVAVIVEDRPTPAQNAVGAHEEEEGLDILGLYEGVPMTDLPPDPSGMLPDVISLFQAPIEEEAEVSGLEVREVIRQTLIHEIGHHFGLDDEEIEKIFEERWERDA